jgi:hypothetical protein
MKVRQQHDSERRYSPLEEKEEPDKEEDDDSKNFHTHSNNPPVAAVTPGPARLSYDQPRKRGPTNQLQLQRHSRPAATGTSLPNNFFWRCDLLKAVRRLILC